MTDRNSPVAGAPWGRQAPTTPQTDTETHAPLTEPQMGAQRFDASSITDAQLDALYDERDHLRAELGDWRYNVALRAFTAPDADLDTVLESLDTRISDAAEALAKQVETAFACTGFHGNGCSAADCCGIHAKAVTHFLRTGEKLDG